MGTRHTGRRKRRKSHLDELLEGLRSKNRKTRYFAALNFSFPQAPKARRALPALRAAMHDPDPEIRVYVARALANQDRKDPAPVEALLQFLQNPDAVLRSLAATELGELPSHPRTAEVVAALVRALGDEVENVRFAAADALYNQRRAAAPAVRALIPLLQDSSSRVRGSTAWTLAAIGSKAKPALPALRAAVRDRSNPARQAAIVALGKIAPRARQTIEALGTALDSDDISVRAAATGILVKAGKAAKGALPGLLRLVSRERDAGPWAEAVKTLANIGPAAREAIPLLEALAQDEHPYFRGAARRALKKIRRGKRA